MTTQRRTRHRAPSASGPAVRCGRGMSSCSAGRSAGCCPTGASSAAPNLAKVFASSRHVKRAVGATAWVILEDIALDATIDDRGRLVADTSVRQIADLNRTGFVGGSVMCVRAT